MNEVFRQEKKFLMSAVAAQQLSASLSQVMTEDSHNGPLGYSIRSLYFDSLDDRDFFEKIDGVEMRRKIRLRIYDPSADFAMLEMKQKEGPYQKKRSLRLSRQDAQKLIAGRHQVLLSYREPFAAECYGVMQMYCYRPRTIVEYQRKAFIAKENKIRITIDRNITATETQWDLFSKDLQQSYVLDPFNVVLEVKFNGFLLSYIKDLIYPVNRSELSVSKYCLARGITRPALL